MFGGPLPTRTTEPRTRSRTKISHPLVLPLASGATLITAGSPAGQTAQWRPPAGGRLTPEWTVA